MRISDWSSDVCSSDLARSRLGEADLGCDLLDELADVAPRPHVARLLLAPHQVAVLVGLELLRQGVARDGIELLQAQDVDFCDAALLALVLAVLVVLALPHPDLLSFFLLSRPFFPLYP